MAHLTGAVPLWSLRGHQPPSDGVKRKRCCSSAEVRSCSRVGEEVLWLHGLRKGGTCEAGRGHKGRWCPLVQVLGQERLGMLGDLLMHPWRSSGFCLGGVSGQSTAACPQSSVRDLCAPVKTTADVHIQNSSIMA